MQPSPWSIQLLNLEADDMPSCAVGIEAGKDKLITQRRRCHVSGSL